MTDSTTYYEIVRSFEMFHALFPRNISWYFQTLSTTTEYSAPLRLCMSRTTPVRLIVSGNQRFQSSRRNARCIYSLSRTLKASIPEVDWNHCCADNRTFSVESFTIKTRSFRSLRTSSTADRTKAARDPSICSADTTVLSPPGSHLSLSSPIPRDCIL